MKYQPIIGLEVHIELRTKSKMFCGCSADHFLARPNTQTCPVCLGLPGALPVPNKKAVEWAILIGLALNCKVPALSKFDRKHYFYPDLPKGYQISQYDKPLTVMGWIQIRGKKIGITRVHLEEDTGKLQHTKLNGGQITLVDFNRSGVPLVEIVTEPDFRTIQEVDIFLKKLQKIVRYLGVSNADMEKGSMRLEPSISIAEIQDAGHQVQNLPDYRVELKNINSFRFARKALEYEIKRQIECLTKGERVIQQTRGWSEEKNATVPQREKEEAHDYRYFPEPDIPPMRFSKSQIANLQSQIPELPDKKLLRFVRKYGLTQYSANILTETREIADKFEALVKKEENFSPKDIANSLINRRPLEIDVVNAISVPDEVIKSVIHDNPKAVADYKGGNQAAIGPLIGAVLARGNFDKQSVIAKLKSHLL